MSANTYIPAHFPAEYDTVWRLLTRQKDSRLSEFTSPSNFEGKSYDINQMGKSRWQSITARARETVIGETPTQKRRLTKAGYDVAELIDEWDAKNLGKIDVPNWSFIQSQLAAFNVLKDLIIVTAALGPAIVPSVNALGIETTTEVVLPNAQKVAIDYVETGSPANSGLTIGKLRQAKYILDDADNDDETPRVIAITAKELQQLLRSVEITNSDYNTVKALVDGKVDTFMGFKFKRVSSVDVLPAVSGVRYLPAMVKGAVNLAVDEARTHVDVRIDKSHAVQIRNSAQVGGVREEDVKVVQIAVDTTLP